MSCGVDCRCGSDLALLWLWCRLAVAAPIQPQASKLPYATGSALKRKKKKYCVTGKQGSVTVHALNHSLHNLICFSCPYMYFTRTHTYIHEQYIQFNFKVTRTYHTVRRFLNFFHRTLFLRFIQVDTCRYFSSVILTAVYCSVV